jgi:hypothetical protein
MTYASKNDPASFLAVEVTGVLFKMTSPKGSDPRPAVGLFSRVAPPETPLAISD